MAISETMLLFKFTKYGAHTIKVMW